MQIQYGFFYAFINPEVKISALLITQNEKNTIDILLKMSYTNNR